MPKARASSHRRAVIEGEGQRLLASIFLTVHGSAATMGDLRGTCRRFRLDERKSDDSSSRPTWYYACRRDPCNGLGWDRLRPDFPGAPKTSREDERRFICAAEKAAPAKETADQPRVWHDAKGRELEAVLVEVKDGKVTLRSKASGKHLTLSIDKLSEPDQQYIKSVGGAAVESPKEAAARKRRPRSRRM